MIASSYSRWIRGLHTFLACAAVVMLGGTRILDYSAYKGADNYLRVVHLSQAIAERDSLMRSYGDLLFRLDWGQVGSFSVENPYGDAYASIQRFWASSPAYDAPDRPAFPHYEMPLQLSHVQTVVTQALATVTPAIANSLAFWRADTPTPPPRLAPATGA